MIGKNLAHYRIEELIGQGGMGDVWRATDLRLGRSVALKVLPPGFSRDSERLARFEREALVLASLNHPNIGAIYGLEHDGERHALVLELVDGPTLRDRIRQGPLEPLEALRIARQIAEAVHAAHEHGVIHRDLKPGNVMLTTQGEVKVLDFGLAKMSEGRPVDLESPDSSQSPTSPVLDSVTGTNMILGTAGYMSPEQARGQAVDKRSDIWAFGVIVFEMLTGERLFGGSTVTDSIAAVLKTDPDWDSLPRNGVPAPVPRLLRQCLSKDPKNRLHDIADARLQIDEALAAPAEPERSDGERKGRRVAAIGLFAGAAAVLLSLWAPWRSPQSPAGSGGPSHAIRFSLPLAAESLLSYWLDIPMLDISRDGTRLVYTEQRGDSLCLVVLSLVSGEGSLLAVDAGSAPFLEPHGTRIGSLDAYAMRSIRPGDRSPTLLTELGPTPRGAYWGDDGHIVYTFGTDDGLTSLDPRDGTIDTLTVLEKGGNVRSHRWPSPLPDNRGILYTASSEDILSFDDAEVRVLDRRTGRSKRVERGFMARYVSSGHLVWARNGTLFASPFDLERLQVTGAAVPVVREVATRTNSGAAHFAVSDDGTLVYIPGPASQGVSTVCRVDREGNATPIEMPSRRFQRVDVSPDGDRLALVIDQANANVWIWDPGRGDLSRLSLRGSNNEPAWSPDGGSVFFSSSRGGRVAIYRQAVDAGAEPERLTPFDAASRDPTVSPDGRYLAYWRYDRGDIHVRRLDVEDEGSPLVQSEFAEWNPRFSPDGRWLAYCSDESGRGELYVRPFPDGAGRWKISVGGARASAWSPDGSRVYWIADDDSMMEAEVSTTPGVRVGRPRRLFSTTGYWPRICVAPDGDFLLIRREPEKWQPDRVMVVANWFAELEHLAPRKSKGP